MQGWRVTLKDGTQVMRAEPMVLPTSAAVDAEKRDVEERMEEEGEKDKEEEEEGEDEDEKDDEG
jgi:ribosomal protein L12E/L44/L45/RPP1/RPP2